MIRSIIYLILLLALLINQSFSQVPEWAKGIVWYQIFPERFSNGDLNNEPEAFKIFVNQDSIPKDWELTSWTSNWFVQSDWEKNLGGNFRDHLYQRRYGGDLQGIINKLDYLKDLGVGAIYLNPVFEAASLHKYDGSTFHHIDVNFGPDPAGDRVLIGSEIPDDPETWVWTSADKLFLKLIEEVHVRDMKIIIDGVFNHTGVEFWAFKDILKNGSKSLYRDWFKINSFDDPQTAMNEFDYAGWWGIKSLPEFNRIENDIHPGPKQYIYFATQRWMDPNLDDNPSDGIDGWRLDVAREVPLGFWKDWSRLVKTINPNSIIVGELWELSPDFVSEQGPFDALMNYNFAYAVKELFIDQKNKISIADFINKLYEVENTYPFENLLVLQNLMASHDTERLTSLITNPDRGYDRDGNEDNKDFNPGKPSLLDYETQKLIAAFQMTFLGAPMIYYGDEVGMWGADDPHCRKPMVWDEFKYDDEKISDQSGFQSGFGNFKVEINKDLFEFYKKLISIRNQYEELRKGNFRFLYSNDEKQSFAFERILGDEKIIVLFNLGNENDLIQIPIDYKKADFKNLVSDESGTVTSEPGKDANLIRDVSPNSFEIIKFYPN